MLGQKTESYILLFSKYTISLILGPGNIICPPCRCRWLWRRKSKPICDSRKHQRRGGENQGQRQRHPRNPTKKKSRSRDPRQDGSGKASPSKIWVPSREIPQGRNERKRKDWKMTKTKSPPRGKVLGADGADHQSIPMMGKSMGVPDAAKQSLVAKRAASLASSRGDPGKKPARIVGQMLIRASQRSPESEPPSRPGQMERKLRLAGREPRSMRFRMLIRRIPIWCYPWIGVAKWIAIFDFFNLYS